MWFDVRDPGDTSVRWINQMRIGNTDRRLNIAVAIILQLLQKMKLLVQIFHLKNLSTILKFQKWNEIAIKRQQRNDFRISKQQGTIGLIVQPLVFKWNYTKVRTLSKIYVRGYFVTRHEHNFQHNHIYKQLQKNVWKIPQKWNKFMTNRHALII